MSGTKQLVRIPNELLALGYSGGIKYQGSEADLNTISVGAYVVAMALCSKANKEGLGPIVATVTQAELLKLLQYPLLSNGTYSRAYRQDIKKNLAQLEERGLVQIQGSLDDWGRKGLRVQLLPLAFRGLGAGGGGFSVLYLEKLMKVLRMSLNPKNKNVCAIPILCYLSRQQTVKGKLKFVPELQPRIGAQKLLQKLGLKGKNHQRNLLAMEKAITFLQQQGVLEGAPERSSSVYTGDIILTLKKSASFFPLTEDQAKALKIRGGKRSANLKIGSTPAPTSTVNVSRSSLYVNRRVNPCQAQEPKCQAEETMCQVEDQMCQAEVTASVRWEDLMGLQMSS